MNVTISTLITATIILCAMVGCKVHNRDIEIPKFKGSKTFITPPFSFIFSSNYCSDTVTIATFYSKKNKSFIGFSFPKSNSIFCFPLPLSLQNENETGELSGYYIHNFDSIFILQNFRLSIIDTSGHTIFTQVINRPELEFLPDTVYGNLGRAFPPYYDGKNQQLFTMQYSGKFKFYEKDFFQIPIEASYHFKTNNFSSLPFHFSTLYTKDY